MADDAKMLRENAEAERAIAACAALPNVKSRALRSAERWDQLAAQADRVRAKLRHERDEQPIHN